MIKPEVGQYILIRYNNIPKWETSTDKDNPDCFVTHVWPYRITEVSEDLKRIKITTIKEYMSTGEEPVSNWFEVDGLQSLTEIALAPAESSKNQIQAMQTLMGHNQLSYEIED
jgi:hypothetical protein